MLTNFNSKLVDSLDHLNKILAAIFLVMAAWRFIEMVGDSPVSAVFEVVSIIGIGVLTCGYIALMLNIRETLQSIANKLD